MNKNNGNQVLDEKKDFTEDARKIFQAIRLLNERYGIGLVISYLLGSVMFNFSAKLNF
jgi:hypothetical protein